ncbi:nuclease-related domain-containing protein [Virgibacillus halophilus]|uniref:Nuclease-related domain-containing protein n=1 Tax=Tigheibacillus halophilus TaxID=361280 RepID=A0ABU5C4L8_9BACI|nr:nuclease-related domain-containing protein [Virgibacillus halophilus]
MDIIKQREYPLALDVLQAMSLRLLASDRRQTAFAEEKGIVQAGFTGEQAIDYYLNFISNKSYRIFHGLRIPWKNDLYFQMDTLIITPYFIPILEVKNLSGKLYFNQLAQQLIRTKNDVEEGFPYPMTQVNRQAQQLEMYLKQSGFPPHTNHPPLVIISRPSTIISTDQPNAAFHDKVMHAENFPERLHRLEKQYPRACLTQKHLDTLSSLLLQAHEPLIPNYRKKLMVEEHELLPGVLCQQCKQLSMVRDFGWWKCIKCQQKKQRCTYPGIDGLLLINQTYYQQSAVSQFHKTAICHCSFPAVNKA